MDFNQVFFSTITSGVLIFTLQNLILKLAIEPAKDFKKQIVSTSMMILENMSKISNASPSKEISDAILRQSALLLAESELIMGYCILRRVYKLPPKRDLTNACKNLNLLSYNMNPDSQEAERNIAFNAKTNFASDNNTLLFKTSKLLKVKLTFEGK